jgi:hypothetical protein
LKKQKRIQKSDEVVYDTIGQAAADTGHPEWVISLARRSGCKAFRKGGRVERDGLNAFLKAHPELFEQPSMTKEQADIKLKEVKIARETLALERDKGLLIRKSEVSETCKSASQHMRAVLQQKLETELPPKCAGKTVIEIAELMRETVDTVCRIFHDRTVQWV